MRVTVIDYKAGNLTSVLKALRHLGAETIALCYPAWATSRPLSG
jgi:imidazoleglycerol phosphate synthase glutamine amidotransferase subunit HisH